MNCHFKTLLLHRFCRYDPLSIQRLNNGAEEQMQNKTLKDIPISVSLMARAVSNSIKST